MIHHARMLLFVFLAGLGLTARGFEIFVDPSDATIDVGATVSLGVMVSGLGDGTAPSIGGYDLTFGWDDSILSLADPLQPVGFGTGLDVNASGTITDVTGTNPLDIAESSLDSEADIDRLQPSLFRLFTVNLRALAAGITVIDITALSITDAAGNALTPNPVTDGRVTVRTTGVPVPGSAALLLLGLGTIGAWRERSGRRADRE